MRPILNKTLNYIYLIEIKLILIEYINSKIQYRDIKIYYNIKKNNNSTIIRKLK